VKQIVRIAFGIVPVGLAFVLFIPTLFSVYCEACHVLSWLSLSMSCLLFGTLCLVISRQASNNEIQQRSVFAIVFLSWCVAAFLGALPFYFIGHVANFVDCLFEAMSGMTGTGATILADIEALPHGLLLWRSLTQILGGMGVIAFFVAILPTLGFNSVHLFRAETAGLQKEQLTPRVIETARTYWAILFGLVGVVAFLLKICGLNAFEAINHAMTAVATGGFSTKNIGVAAFKNTAVEYVMAGTMLVCSLNFSILYLLLTGGWRRIRQDTELKGYLGIVTAFVILLTVCNYIDFYPNFSQAFKAAFFTVVNTVSSSGFTNINYLEWGGFSQLLVLLLMIMGGMSGSTSGGVKCVRVIVAWRLVMTELKKFLHPSAIINVRLNGSAVRPELANLIWAFFFVYIGIIIILVAVLTLSGLHFESAFSVSIAMLSNIGPAFGDFGPYANYANLPSITKTILVFAMLVGRLEFFTALVIFTPAYWKK